MKAKLLALAVSAVLTIALLEGAMAATGNAHFIKNATGASLNGSSLVCKFKEAGLAAGSTETVTCSTTETIVYECVNGGGKNPAASNKKTFSTAASTSGKFTADKNGNIVGTLTINPVSAASLGFSCPSGQRVTLVSVSYSNITITDQTSGASQAVSGTLSYTNPSAPPVR
jgi:hypothetical protein